MASPTPQGYSPPVFVAFFRWTNLAPLPSAVIFGRGSARGLFLAHGGRSQNLAHSESGGRSRPAPHPKAISHPFLWPFSAARTWRTGLRAVIFGRGCAHGLFLAHRGISQSLAPFRARRTKLAISTPQGYSPPFFVAFFRWMDLAPRPSGCYFWARLCPRPIFGTRRPLAKSRPFRVRRSKLASPTPQCYSPPVFVAFFRWTNLAPRPSGGHFWARLCPGPIFGTRRPLAKSRAIPSPADEVGQPHPPML